jgi:DnaD/phage-associated family protein
MMTGRTMSRQEASKLTEAVKVYNIEPDILNFAIDYCEDLQKYNVDYIFKVALRWTEEGCRDVGQVKEMLDRHSRRSAAYGHVFRSLGFNRLPNPADREIMDRWFDEMGCSLREVLDACAAAAGIRDPNLRYVNKVLENRMLEKGGINTKITPAQESPAEHRTEKSSAKAPEARVSRRVLREYYDHIRAEEDKKRASRTEEIKRNIPEFQKLLDEESKLNLEMISIDPSSQDKRERIRNNRKKLEEKKIDLLTENGYPADYLNKHYRCDICRDTGYTDEGRVCTCCRERAEEAYKWIQET